MDRSKRSIRTPARYKNYEAPSAHGSALGRNIMRVKFKQQTSTPQTTTKPVSVASTPTTPTDPAVPTDPTSPNQLQTQPSLSKSPPPSSPTHSVTDTESSPALVTATKVKAISKPSTKPATAKQTLIVKPAPLPKHANALKSLSVSKTPSTSKPANPPRLKSTPAHTPTAHHVSYSTTPASTSIVSPISSPHHSPPPKKRSMRFRPKVVSNQFDDVIPNTILPFWDARTAAEIHEDDNVKELVHCRCGIDQESGLMVQCETCLTWQHALCLGLGEKEDEVPDGYTCSACAHPKDVRESMKYLHDQEWLTKGKMKIFDSVKSKKEISPEKIEQLKRNNELIERLMLIKKLIHSYKLKRKLLDSTTEDSDAKLKLFRNRWDDFNQSLVAGDIRLDGGEAGVDECRKNLKIHLNALEKHILNSLQTAEEEVVILEKTIAEDCNTETPTLESLKNDLACMKSIVNHNIR